MFSKDSKSTSTPPSPAPAPEPPRTTSPASRSATPSIISRDLKIKGDLICNGDIQIDGTIEGDVVSRSITVGEGADVRGAISGEAVRICGSVNGQIKGTTVTLDTHALHYGARTLKGTFHHTPRHFAAALAAIADGSIPAGELITGAVALDDLVLTFERLERGEGIKYVVRPWSE